MYACTYKTDWVTTTTMNTAYPKHNKSVQQCIFLIIIKLFTFSKRKRQNKKRAVPDSFVLPCRLGAKHW